MKLVVACADRILRIRVGKLVAEGGHDYTFVTRDQAGVTRDQAGDLERAQGLVALLPLDPGSGAYIFYTIGLAAGRELPTLVLAEDGVSETFLGDVTTIHGGFANLEALAFHINLFAGAIGSPRHEAPTPKSRVNAAALRSELNDIRGIENHSQSAALFEQLVEHLLRSGGAQVAAAAPPKDAGFDLVVSVPGLAPRTGAVLVECKRLRSTSGIAQAAQRLQSTVLNRGGVLGILVYDESLLPQKQSPRPVSLVVQVGVEELISRASVVGLGPALAAVRDAEVERL